ncbi:ABC transporter substrate-binding protein [Propionivibrio sp.]|uniref:ABC transporter substrate-binding protein n=1 Tax=Propionivibrio sp. TaxID=2212460 RepID=UPI0039E43505
MKRMLFATLLSTAALAASMPAAAAEAREVRVGVLLPLTGSSAETGKISKNGIELAINTINAQGGIKSLGGARLVPVYADSAGKPETGVTEIERLIVKDKVNVLVGPYNSNVAAPTAEVAEKYSTPYMLTNAVADGILQKGYKYVWRANQSASGDAIDLIAFLADAGRTAGKPVKNIALVYESTDWGSSTAEALKKRAQEAGMNVVAAMDYPANTADMTSIVVKLKSLNPDVVLTMSYLNDALLFTRTAQEMRLNSAILAASGGFSLPAFVDKSGKSAEYVMTLCSWKPDILNSKPAASKKLNEDYKARYGTDFSDYSANAWMSAMVLFDAVERAGSLKPEAIKAAMDATDIKGDHVALSLHAYDGISFNQEIRGMRSQNIHARQVIVQVQNGRFRMVWPFDMAPKDVRLNWPIPAWSDRK